MQVKECAGRAVSGCLGMFVGLLLASAGTGCGGTAPTGSTETETSERASVDQDTDPALPRVAADRRDAVARLIKENPAAALRVGRHVDLEGELEVVYEDYADGSARLRHVLKAEGRRVSLHFTAQPPEILSGSSVSVSGVRADDAMALDPSAILTLGAAGGSKGGTNGGTPAPVPSTFGDQRTLVILVNFQDQQAEPYTTEHARDVVFGTVSDFFRENSYGQTWLSGDVYGWFTVAVSSTVCDSSTLASQADSAAQAAGVNLSAYTHIMYAFQNACGGRGFGTVGGNPSRSWINGTLDLDVVAHELGHGLGLWHSRAVDCGALTIGQTCTTFEYGHRFDTMGNTAFGHFNAFHKERLGWLGYGASPAITTVSTGGTYLLDAFQPAGSGPKALKILKSVDPVTGKRTWYYVEARKALGFDEFLAGNGNVLGGVLVSTGSESSGDTSDLLDMTPASATTSSQDWSDPALVVGNRFEDAGAGVSFTTEWVTPTQAAVAVQLGSAPVIVEPAQPDITVSTDQSSYTRSQTVTITARVTTQSVAVAGAPVSFRVTKPNGAVVNASGTTGSNGTVAYKLRLKRQDPVGSYQASATATAGAPPASASTTFSVQ